MPVLHGHGRGKRLGTLCCICFNMPILHGHAGKRLGTCLVLRVSRVLLVYSMRQCFNMQFWHRHGQGKRLGTCLVLHAVCLVCCYASVLICSSARAWTRQAPWYVPCALVRALCCSRVSVSVLLVYSMRQCFNMPVLHGHGRGKRLGTCLVLQPCVSCVVSLQHASMF